MNTSLCAVLLAEACNTGPEPLVHNDISALRLDRLSWVNQNYVREETLLAANAKLVSAQNQIALAHAWGGGEVASADGVRFVVPVATVHAGPNPKYFGIGRGVTYYNLTSFRASDQALRLRRQFRSERCKGRHSKRRVQCLYCTSREGVREAFADTGPVQVVPQSDQQDVGDAAELYCATAAGGIKVPTWIVDADHDEAIKRENTLFMADQIPDSGLLLQPAVSHFSFLQDPEQFSSHVLHFLQYVKEQ